MFLGDTVAKYALAKEIFDLVHQTDSLHNKVGSGDETSSCRVYNRKSVQLPYGFYTHHLDRMMG